MTTLSMSNGVKPSFKKVVIRVLVLLLMWAGMYHLYTTTLNTDSYVSVDLLSSFGATILIILDKDFRKWFFDIFV